MITGIIINNTEYEIPSDCAFSVGQSATTRDTRAYDYTKTSQSLVLVTRGQPNTYSISFNITSREADNVYKQQELFDGLVGKHGELIYSGYPLGDVFVNDASFVFKTDSVLGVVAVSVTLNLRENRKATPLTDAKVIM